MPKPSKPASPQRRRYRFLDRRVLQIELDETALLPIRPGKPKRIPTVLSWSEAKQVIAHL